MVRKTARKVLRFLPPLPVVLRSSHQRAVADLKKRSDKLQTKSIKAALKSYTKAKRADERRRSEKLLKQSPDEISPREKTDIVRAARDMFGGFSDAGLSYISEMAETSSTHWRARAAAYWALGRYYAMQSDPERSLEFIHKLRRTAPDEAGTIRVLSLEIDQLGALNSIEEAFSAVADAERQRGYQPEFTMALCNIFQRIGKDDLRAQLITRLMTPEGSEGTAFQADTLSFKSLNNVCSRNYIDSDQKLSVLIPAYNCADTIGIAARGVLNQTWRNLELIIVDDCSTDETWKTICELAEMDERIRPIRGTRNQGAYACRNAALAVASGKYVTVHDSDDWSHPDKFAVQMQKVEDDEQPNLTMAANVDDNLRFVLSYPQMNSIVGNTSSLIFNTQMLRNDFGGWDRVRISADSELYNRVRRRGGRPLTVQERVPLALLHTSPSSLTRSSSTGMQSMIYGARREYRDSYVYWQTRQSIRNEPLLIGSDERQFVAPYCITFDKPPVSVDTLYAGDFSSGELDDTVIPAIQEKIDAGETVAVHHIPAFAAASHTISPDLREVLAEKTIPVAVAGDKISSGSIHLLSPNTLEVIPDRKPHFSADSIYVDAAVPDVLMDKITNYFGEIEVRSLQRSNE